MEKNMYKKETPEERLLMLTTYGKNHVELKRVLDKGADANFRNKVGESVLYRAVMSGNPKFIEMLLEKGAKPNVCTKPPKEDIYGRPGPKRGASCMDAVDYQIAQLEQLKAKQNEGYEADQKYMIENKCLIPQLDPQALDGTLKYCPIWYIPKYMEIKEILGKAGAKPSLEVTDEDEQAKGKGMFGF